uniref:Uncharacterized protein n=1 Tax=Strongyloides papillosus TaxID=174720 RepID=A0A0N5BJZ4_STREA
MVNGRSHSETLIRFLKNLGSPSTHNKDIRDFSNFALTSISSKSFQLTNPLEGNLPLLSDFAIENSRTLSTSFKHYSESTHENSIYLEHKSGPRSEPKENITLNTLSKITEYHDIENNEQLNKLIEVNLNHMHINFFNSTDKIIMCVWIHF